MKDSEFRLYPYMQDRLKELGWNIKTPNKGGDIYTQGEIKQNTLLKEALGNKKPEYVVEIENSSFWVLEAKANSTEMSKAIEQAKQYAENINKIKKINCKLITGVVGNEEEGIYIETQKKSGDKWEPLLINNRQSTGFITKKQATEILKLDKANLLNYEIADSLFKFSINLINEILHNGSINKRNRASVLASLLLAIADDPDFKISNSPSTLISDINARVKNQLNNVNKGNFAQEIIISMPVSKDNHVKIKRALIKSINILRFLNIASAINSGRDILGQSYEIFLKYANDAKEIGIVLTPRHITTFGAECLDIKKEDIVFDPTCGTGGFLVSALDKVRKDNRGIDEFKKGNLYGIEQDPMVATLGIVNMVFRGDGSSNILEGNCFSKEIKYSEYPNKVLMNPPFALKNKEEYEHRFVDRALKDTKEGGLLFAILPTTTMGSSNNKRKEINWRIKLLERHTLLSVIKLPNDLFIPVMKGTYAIILKAHEPHRFPNNVVWAILEDGIIRSKTQQEKSTSSNTDLILEVVKDNIFGNKEKKYIPRYLDCQPIRDKKDLTPEFHIGYNDVTNYDVRSVFKNIEQFNLKKKYINSTEINIKEYQYYAFKLEDFAIVGRGRSKRKKEVSAGELPMITTSEINNGVSDFVNKNDVNSIYENAITISANGGSCYAHYHDYEFAANPDVFVVELKKEYKIGYFAIFLCSAINSESWRFNYCRKFSTDKMEKMNIKLPADNEKTINLNLIKKIVEDNK
jgi:type I restriction-modification system DNA methylase subunit